MVENKHQWIDILKIDIEGYEYEVLSTVLADLALLSPHTQDKDRILPFSQLQIEIHLSSPNMDAHEPASFSRFLDWFQRLEGWGLRPFFSELNMIPALSTQFQIGMDYCEFSFINIRGKHALVGSKAP